MSPTFNKILESDLEKLKQIVGKQYVFIEPEIRWTYAFGAITFNKEWIPDLILMPQNSAQVSMILKYVNLRKIPITPRGSGTSLSGGSLTPYGGIVLDLSLMNKILKIDIENNLVEVEPGVVCDNLNNKLKQYGYFFPPDPGSSAVCTIGGMVATNSGGVQAFKYGVTKDYVLHIECILVDGSKVELGTNVLKSVSSYNLKDLFIGSEGTLGVITKIGLRIKPLPKERKLGFYIFETIDDLSNAVLKLRKKGIVPILLEFLDKLTAKAVFENLGGAFIDYPIGYVLLADIEGKSKNEIEVEFSKLHKIMLMNKPIVIRIAENQQERDDLISARKAALPALSRISPTCCLEDCTIQITNFAEVIKKIEKISENLNIPNIKVATFGHMEGNLHPTFLFNENDDKDIIDFKKAKDYLYRKIIIPVGGTITGEHGIGKIKTQFLELEHGKKVVEMMAQIKNLYDPNKILNPGIGKADNVILKKKTPSRKLKNLANRLLEFNCMRCGFCKEVCPSKLHYKIEAYSPRGRLCLLNALVFGDLKPNQIINNIFHTCTLCGSCLTECPASVPTTDIFEKAREILHS
ncbi:MAG: FAD-linked oxidase C-terminal domain-containing protein [Candidatus Hodarchaeota archaeon]